jgi:hypothetical protein
LHAVSPQQPTGIVAAKDCSGAWNPRNAAQTTRGRRFRQAKREGRTPIGIDDLFCAMRFFAQMGIIDLAMGGRK